jgi:5-carboxymethyl-2-hydroxymuconate isomerase
MPHVVIEQGNALLTPQDRHDAMRILGGVAGTYGFIAAADLKIRIVDSVDFLMLDGRRSFVHVTVHMLAGRSLEQKEKMTIRMRTAMVGRFSDVDSISIAFVDLEPQSYKKHLRS